MSELQLDHISVEPNGKKILVIPNLHVAQGERIGIIGPNGAGKSTLLKLLAQLILPATGKMLVDGQVLSSEADILAYVRKTAFVWPTPSLFNTTVRQNVAVGLKIRGLAKKDIQGKVDEWLEKMQIAHLANRMVGKLSTGEAQKVNLTRALVTEPEILFLDEPFSGVDFPSKADLVDHLMHIFSARNMTVFFCSHDLQEVRFLSDRLLVLLDGQVVQDGRVEDVLGNPHERIHPFISRLQKFR